MVVRTHEQLKAELGKVIGFLVFLFVCVILFLAWLYQETEGGPLFGGYVLLFSLGLTYWVWNSIYLIRNDEALEVYFFGTHWHTFASGSLYPTLDRRAQEKYEDLDIQGGHFSDICFLPWGIFRVIRFGTVDVSVKLLTVSIFTAPTNETDPTKAASEPRLNLTAEVEMVFRFLTIRYLLPTIDIPPYSDLTVSCDVPIYGMEEDKRYKGSRLTYVLAHKFQPLVAEASRKAATYFTWEGKETDIQDNKHYLEIISLFILAQVGSNFERARILERPTKGGLRDNHDPELTDFMLITDLDVDDFWAIAMHSVDLNIDKLVPASPDEDPNKINRAYEGILTARQRVNEAQAQYEEEAKAGEGRAAALKAIVEAAEEMGFDKPQIAYLLDVLKTREIPINLTQFGGDLKSLIENILTSKK